jgi:putative SOS response-associated peptidase YedK
LQLYPAEKMETYPVSDSVNNPRHDATEQILPVDPPQPKLQQPLLFPI